MTVVLPVSAAPKAAILPRSSLYRAIRRWHSSAGLLTVPFMVLLAATGSIDLFHDEIEHTASTKDGIMTNRPSRLALVAALVAAVLGGSVGAAAAHAHLKTATPAADASLATPPTELRLGFTEGLNLKFTGVAVTGPSGTVAIGAATLSPGDDKVLVVPVSSTLAPGSYKVDWHALATDGHKTNGSYGFIVKP